MQTDLAAAARARETNPNRPAQWWPDAATKLDSYYRSDCEARRIAEALSSQLVGWVLPAAGRLSNTTREAFTGDESKAGPWARAPR